MFSKNSPVIELTPNHFIFNKGIAKVDHPKAKGLQGMVVIVAEYCGYCKQFKPTYEETARQLKNVFPMFYIDGVKYNDLISKLGVNSFPTTKYISRSGHLYKKFDGERTVSNLLESICNETKKCVSK